jgi:phage/plasmid-associated DNA primase
VEYDRKIRRPKVRSVLGADLCHQQRTDSLTGCAGTTTKDLGPSSIVKETDTYIGENDVPQHFVDEKFERSPNPQARLEHKTVYELYSNWILANGTHYKLESGRLAAKLLEKRMEGRTIHRVWVWSVGRFSTRRNRSAIWKDNTGRTKGGKP